MYSSAASAPSSSCIAPFVGSPRLRRRLRRRTLHHADQRTPKAEPHIRKSPDTIVRDAGIAIVRTLNKTKVRQSHRSENSCAHMGFETMEGVPVTRHLAYPGHSIWMQTKRPDDARGVRLRRCVLA